MKRSFVAIALLVASVVPLGAQEVCPVKHLALTPLEHPAMEAAYLASFRGLYHRDPTGAPGSGPDDTGWWIRTFDHYGEYSDGICRAGWNLYTELRLAGAGSVAPTLGDESARFQPGRSPAPTPVPLPAPTPQPMPAPAEGVLLAKVDALTVLVQELVRADGDAHAAINQNVTDGRTENRSFFAAVGQHWKSITAIGGGLVAAFYTGKQVTKP
jgi:hypothetical protein